MEDKHRRILRSLRTELCRVLRVDVCVQFLYQERVLSLSQLEAIQAEPVSANKDLKLLDHLPSRGPKAFALFAESLREEFPWVTTQLLLEEQRAEETGQSATEEFLPVISDQLLDSVPSDQKLNQLSSQLGPEWESVMVSLGLKEADMYRCKMNHQYNVRAQILAALVLWKQRLGKQATVRSLCVSLTASEVDSSVIGDIFQERH
uniref:CASP2 and RIPK1 domain-containing adaptor with death domain protein n=1 Tax=Callorhinchus milii TaxID=7868 RepID=V9LAX8_CALMI